MIGKQIKGKGFKGVLSYILNPEKGTLIGGNMDGNSLGELTKEFTETRRLNPRLKKPVYHVSLSLAYDEHLNDFDWNQIADRYMVEMGFERSQYVVAKHIDAEHEHIHIVASRIRLDGKTVSDSNNYQRSERIIRVIEKTYSLQQVISSRDVEQRGLSSGELRAALKSQNPSVKMRMQAIIDQEVKQSLTMIQLIEYLRRQGISIIPNKAVTDRISGITYCLDGEMMKGSDLGRGYTFFGLQKRGIHFDPNRDLDAFNGRPQQSEIVNTINVTEKTNYLD